MEGDDLGYGAGRFMQGDSLFSQPGLMPWNYQAPQFQAPLPPILQSPMAPQAAAPQAQNNPYSGFRASHPGWNMNDNDIRRYMDFGR